MEDDGNGEGDETKELRAITRMLYTKAGSPRVAVGRSEQLPHDKLVFIDTFILQDAYRGRGLAQQALRNFHKLVPHLADHDFADHEDDSERDSETTVVLSPAGSASVRIDNGKSDVEIERGLIRNYGKSGYEVWIQGDEGVYGSVTVLGTVVRAGNLDGDIDSE